MILADVEALQFLSWYVSAVSVVLLGLTGYATYLLVRLKMLS